MMNFISLSLLAAALLALPNCLRALRLLVQHGPGAASLEQAGWAILKTLTRIGVMRAEEAQIRVAAAWRAWGRDRHVHRGQTQGICKRRKASRLT